MDWTGCSIIKYKVVGTKYVKYKHQAPGIEKSDHNIPKDYMYIQPQQ